MKTLTIIIPLVILPTVTLTAATVITGVTATASTNHGVAPPSNLVNGSGLLNPSDSSTGYYDVDALHIASTTAEGQWHSDNETTPIVIFNLGGAYNLSDIHIWNITQPGSNNRGVRDFTLTFSNDGVNYELYPAVNGELDQSPDWVEISAQSFSLTSYDGVTHVKLQVDSNYGSNDTSGLAEVMFTAIPEPSVALLGGIALLSFLRRRR